MRELGKRSILFLMMATSLFGAWPGLAAPVPLQVTATVLSKSNCRFTTATSALNFGSLNPANFFDVTVSTTVTFRCGGSAPMATFFISQDSGLYNTGPGFNRMRHATVLTEYLPYGLALNPTSATVPKNVNQTLTITGTVKAVDYQNAYAGNYADTVVLSITP